MSNNIIKFSNHRDEIKGFKSWEWMEGLIDRDFLKNGILDYADLFKNQFKPAHEKFSELKIPFPNILDDGEESTKVLISQIEESKEAIAKFVASLLVDRYERELEIFCEKYFSN